MIYTVVLPWPDAALSANGRGHRMKKARLTKTARELAFWSAREAGLPRQMNAPIRATATFNPPGNYRYDDDNLVSRIKAYRDGIADAIGVDDHYWTLEDVFRGVVSPGGEVIISLEPGPRADCPRCERVLLDDDQCRACGWQP